MTAGRREPWPRGRSRDGGIDEIPLPRGSGRLWLCGKRVVGPDPLAALSRVGAGTVLCLCQEHELVERYPEYLAWLRTADPAQARWFPTPDLGVRPLDEFLDLVDRSAAALAAGQRLVAHCAAGIGRSGTFAAAVLLALDHDRATALATVARHRPTAGPEVGAQAEQIEAVADHYRSPTGGSSR